jgi:hypothetical protein
MRAASTVAVPCLLAAALGCAAVSPRPRAAPLEGEGLLLVYLAPAPRGAESLSFSVEAVAALGPGNTAVPLARALERVDLSTLLEQRLLASARVPPGAYPGLSLSLSGGALARGEGVAADLLPPEGPMSVEAPFAVSAGGAAVLSLAVVAAMPGGPFRLAPSFALGPADRPIPSLAALVTGTTLLTQVDRKTLQVGGADVVPRGPAGVAVDAARGLAYVAEAEGDVVAVLDVSSGERLREIRLQPGDRPGVLALTPDGALAVVLNRGPETAAFLDTQSGQEVGRAPVGQDPRALLVDRQGRFAYAVNRASNGVTVLDLATRTAVGTLGTDAAPVGVALGRAGDVLYVAHAGSAFLTSFRLPDRTGAGRLYVGLGASAVQVDAKTGLIALALRDERVIRLYAPGQETPLAEVALPGAATRLLLDDVWQALVALVPESRKLVSVDLATRRVRAVADLPEEPVDLALTGERR